MFGGVRHFCLPSETSDEESTTPYNASRLQNTLLDLVGSRVEGLPERIVVAKSCQLGLTTTATAAMSYVLAGHGGRVTMALPTATEVGKWSRSSREQMFESCGPLAVLRAASDRRKGAICLLYTSPSPRD